MAAKALLSSFATKVLYLLNAMSDSGTIVQ